MVLGKPPTTQGGTTLVYNNQPIDSPGASLEGTNYWTPAIQGRYSVLLQGGSIYYPYGTNGAAIGQTGQLPLSAKSILYWGLNWNSLRISFNGQLLAFIAISNTPTYTVFGADISGYAGQTAELLFHAPWAAGGGVIDRIQFSSETIPEPTTTSIFGLLILFVRRRTNHLLATKPSIITPARSPSEPA
jgi:hypothetical protein